MGFPGGMLFRILWVLNDEAWHWDPSSSIHPRFVTRFLVPFIILPGAVTLLLVPKFRTLLVRPRPVPMPMLTSDPAVSAHSLLRRGGDVRSMSVHGTILPPPPPLSTPHPACLQANTEWFTSSSALVLLVGATFLVLSSPVLLFMIKVGPLESGAWPLEPPLQSDAGRWSCHACGHVGWEVGRE